MRNGQEQFREQSPAASSGSGWTGFRHHYIGMIERLPPGFARALAVFESRVYFGLLCAALLWAVANCVFVYFWLGADKVYRIESAVILLAVLLLPSALRPAGGNPGYVVLPRRTSVALVALALVLWAIIYVPLLDYPFLSDDYVFLELYDRIEDIDQAPQFFRPFYAFVFWALAAVSDGSPLAFHLLGFSLHLCSSYFVYKLAGKLFHANGPAILSGIVFLLNPLQLEAVLWVSGLQDALWVFFVLGAMVLYAAEDSLSPARVALTSAVIALGLLSKETAVSYILLIPPADWVFFGFRRGKWLPLAYGVFVIELLAYLATRAWFLELESTYLQGPSRYFAKQIVTTPYRFFAQPWNVSAIDVPNWVLCAAAVLAITSVWWVIAVRRQPAAILTGAFVILASTVPVYSYFFVRSDLFSARYLYCAAAGWGLIVAAAASGAVRSRRAFLACTSCVALTLAASLHLNLRPWRTAASVIRVLSGAVAANQAPTARLKQWASENNVELIFRDSTPYEYKGVGIFINGYDGFLRLASSQNRHHVQ